MTKILIIGACGQIGTELVLALRQKHDNQSVIASDVRENCPELIANGPYIQLDILNREEVRNYIIENKIDQVYLLAALLSATAEKNPDFAWKLHMAGLFTILDLAKEGYLKRIFWPSSIAVLDQQRHKIKRHNKQLWNHLLFMVFQNWQVKIGAHIIIQSLVLMLEVFVILDLFPINLLRGVEQLIMLWIFFTKLNQGKNLIVF